jgi:hypothetical protein
MFEWVWDLDIVGYWTGILDELAPAQVAGKENIHTIHPDIYPIQRRDPPGSITGWTVNANTPVWQPVNVQIG